MKILVVEDNAVSRKIAKTILEKAGYKVITAKDGKEAWNLVQTDDVKLIVTDWMMPQMDGPTLCRKIRKANFPFYVYLILLTSRDKKEDMIQGFESGADDFVSKPVKAYELRARVQAGERIVKLEEELKHSQGQILQSEKMASVGQLAAGVAHEINNPTGFVNSNLKTLTDYQKDITELVKEYRKLIAGLQDISAKDDFPVSIAEQVSHIATLESEVDVDYILDDIEDLIKDCQEGTERIKKIVLDLKDFAHPGEDKIQTSDINNGIDSTLNVVWNELKYKATVTKDYGDLPLVKCYPQQLNQVFMNILVNAAQAIKKNGEIRIMTRADNEHVEIEISDTGSGIPPEIVSKIFDPFFTTKDVGKGTGLGLNVAYNIINKHKGTIKVESEAGKGTTFKIRIPV